MGDAKRMMIDLEAIPTPESEEAFALLPLDEQRAFWEGYFAARPGWPKEPSGGPGAHLTSDEAKAAGLASKGGYRLGVEDDEGADDAEGEEEPSAAPEPTKAAPPKPCDEVAIEERVRVHFATRSSEPRHEVQKALGISDGQFYRIAAKLRKEGKLGGETRASVTQQRVVEYVLANPLATNREVSRALGVPDTSVCRIRMRLRKERGDKPARASRSEAKALRILDYWRANPALSNAEVAAKLGASASVVSRALMSARESSRRSESVSEPSAPLSPTKENAPMTTKQTMTGRPKDPTIEARRTKVLALFEVGKAPSAIAAELKLPRKTVENDLVVLRARSAGAKKIGSKPKPAKRGRRKAKPSQLELAPKPGTVAKGYAGMIPFPPDDGNIRATAPRGDAADAVRQALEMVERDAEALRAALAVLERRSS